LLRQGAYPRIYDRGIPASQWLADYTTTDAQRVVRQVINVGDLQAFSGFLKLCAGRMAQEINLSKLGSDSGVSHNTARSWLSVMETSYIIHRLPAWHTNIRKQVVKAPKLHFFDSGLVCYLLGSIVLVICNEDTVGRFDADIPLYRRPGCLVVVMIGSVRSN